MQTVFDYLNYYNDVSFKDCCWNDMDNIICSTLVYLPLEHVIDKKTINIREVNRLIKYRNNHQYGDKSLRSQAIKILEKISGGLRYKNTTFSNFTYILNDQTQFSALTIRLGRGICYIAYRGTDNSLSGWKEDFELLYKYPVKAQELAADYLKNSVKFTDKTIFVGGHSKGGNLAMSSVMEVEDSIYRKIKVIYNNDGPGFLPEEFKSTKFKKITKKLKMFMPEDSRVGTILLHTKDVQFVKSINKGTQQHDLTSWICFGGFLVHGRQSQHSIKKQEQVNAILKKISRQDKEKIVNTFFTVLKESKIKYFYQLKELKFPQISAMIKEAHNIDEASKQLLLETFKTLFSKESQKEEKEL